MRDGLPIGLMLIGKYFDELKHSSSTLRPFINRDRREASHEAKGR
jgi:hypothetical protein